MNKILLYTANINGYDKTMVEPQPGLSFMEFTNFNPYDTVNAVKQARRHKIIMPISWDYNIWVDANIKINCDLKSYVHEHLIRANIDMVVMEHGRNCTYEEADVCIEKKKDTAKNINEQMDYYKKIGMPTHSGMVGTGILMRKNNKKVNDFMKHWWRLVKKYSYRDQLSFSFVQWSMPKHMKLRLGYIPYSVFQKEFSLIPHGMTKAY